MTNLTEQARIECAAADREYAAAQRSGDQARLLRAIAERDAAAERAFTIAKRDLPQYAKNL